MTLDASAYIQFITYYQHPSGPFKLVVSTYARLLVEPHDPRVLMGFDQDAAAVLIARLAVHKSETEEGTDALRWLDRQLIRLCTRFGDFRAEDATSFRLPPQFAVYPTVMFYLRRSQFMHVFNNSPDETAFYRYTRTFATFKNYLIAALLPI